MENTNLNFNAPICKKRIKKLRLKGKVTSGSYMFSRCTSLVGGNGATYNDFHVDATYARMDTAGTPGYFTDIADKS